MNKGGKSSYCQSRNGLVICMRVWLAIFLANTSRHNNCIYVCMYVCMHVCTWYLSTSVRYSIQLGGPDYGSY